MVIVRREWVLDVAGDLDGKGDVVVNDVFEVDAGEFGVGEEYRQGGLTFVSLVLGNAAGVQVRAAQALRHAVLGDV